MARLDENGHEQLDPNPIEVPVGFKRPETLAEQVQRLVRTSVSLQAEQEGYESFEEANDFDIDGENDPFADTPYETFFDPILGVEMTPYDFAHNQEEYKKMYEHRSKTITRKDLLEAFDISESDLKGLISSSEKPTKISETEKSSAEKAETKEKK